MNANTATTWDQIQTPANPAEAWVYEVLEPDQLSKAKPLYGQRELSRGTLILLWCLRFYVVLMVFIIVVEIRNAL